MNKLGRVDEAIKLFDPLFGLKSDNVKDYFSKALFLMELQEYEKAIELWDNIIRIKADPRKEYVEIHQILGDNLLDMKIYPEEEYKNKILCLNKLGKHKEAITILDTIIHNDEKESEWAYSLKAEYLMGLERYNEAIELWDELIEMNMFFPKKEYKNKILCLNKLGKHKEALTILDNIIKNNNGKSRRVEWTYSLKAEYLMGLERYEEAIEYCDKSISLISQENPTPYEYKAMCLKKLGKHEEAEKCYDKAIDEHSAWLSTIIHRD